MQELFPVYSIKAYRGSGDIDPLILDLDGGGWLTSRPGCVTAGKEPLYPGWAPVPVLTLGKEKNDLPLIGI